MENSPSVPNIQIPPIEQKTASISNRSIWYVTEIALLEIGFVVITLGLLMLFLNFFGVISLNRVVPGLKFLPHVSNATQNSTNNRVTGITDEAVARRVILTYLRQVMKTGIENTWNDGNMSESINRGGRGTFHYEVDRNPRLIAQVTTDVSIQKVLVTISSMSRVASGAATQDLAQRYVPEFLKTEGFPSEYACGRYTNVAQACESIQANVQGRQSEGIIVNKQQSVAVFSCFIPVGSELIASQEGCIW